MAKNKFSDNAREVLHYLQNTTQEDMTFRDIADAIEKPYRSVSAIITSLDKAVEALEGKAGTTLV